MKNISLIIGIVFLLSCSSSFKTPFEQNNFSELTSYDEMINFIKNVSSSSGIIDLQYLGETAEGRQIPYLLISKHQLESDESKIKVMVFADQHGNEQSGKEGALLLLAEIANGNLDYLFDEIDLILIPDANPDGSMQDQRRNANGADLNRNHLILTENETIGLHKLFNKYLPEATLDVHEYSPYSNDWIEFGTIKNFDEQIGAVSNPNVSRQIKNFTRAQYIPFITDYLEDAGFTSHEYLLEGPPNKGRIRLSTFDINDGRQSFGSLNTFSIIMEGKNGHESLDNIKHRAEGQYTGMKGFLEFVYQNKDEIKLLVEHERQKLIDSKPGEKVAIQMEHAGDGSELNLTLLSVSSNNDTVVVVKNYTPVIEPLLEVEKPVGYLVPKSNPDLSNWVQLHNIITTELPHMQNSEIIRYIITAVDSLNFEGDMVIKPSVKTEVVNAKINLSDYYFIPTNQLYSNIIVQALEPQSEIGLATYKEYEYLVRKDEAYPIMKIVIAK